MKVPSVKSKTVSRLPSESRTGLNEAFALEPVTSSDLIKHFMAQQPGTEVGLLVDVSLVVSVSVPVPVSVAVPVLGVGDSGVAVSGVGDSGVAVSGVGDSGVGGVGDSGVGDSGVGDG